MHVITAPTPRGLNGDAANLARALHEYAKQHPGGGGGAMLELRDDNNLPAFCVVLDKREMDKLAELISKGTP